MTKCPLCLSTETHEIEKINFNDIIREYEKTYNISLDNEATEIKYNKCDICNLKFFTPTISGTAKFYESLQENPWYYLDEKEEYTLAKKYIPENGSILEIGAGKGIFATIIGTEKYTGLEFNDEAIAKAKKHNIKLLNERIEEHAKNHKEHYDCVLSFQVLEHVADPNSFITSCFSALKQGGYLIFAVPNNDGICGISQNNILDLPPHHLTHWNSTSLRYIENLINVEVVAIETENISKIHNRWAKKSIIEHKLRQKLGINKKILDTSLRAKLIGKISSVLCRIIKVNHSHIDGHSVIACYKKLK